MTRRPASAAARCSRSACGARAQAPPTGPATAAAPPLWPIRARIDVIRHRSGQPIKISLVTSHISALHPAVGGVWRSGVLLNLPAAEGGITRRCSRQCAPVCEPRPANARHSGLRTARKALLAAAASRKMAAHRGAGAVAAAQDKPRRRQRRVAAAAKQGWPGRLLQSAGAGSAAGSWGSCRQRRLGVGQQGAGCPHGQAPLRHACPFP